MDEPENCITLPSRGDKSIKVYADPMCLRAWEILHYNEETGEFRWKVDRGSKAKAGDVAGWNDNGYRSVRFDDTNHKAHRIAWLMATGYWPKDQIDHINLIRQDNRLKNLREATQAQNGQNVSMTRRNSSGYIGVSWAARAGKWLAQIQVNWKNRHLGYFDTPEEASEAYKRAKRELHKFNPEVA